MYFIRTVGIGGLFGGAAYLFVALARAFFHEGTVLLNRRHATRLGRLYMMVKYGQKSSQDDVIKPLRENISHIINNYSRSDEGREPVSSAPMKSIDQNILIELIRLSLEERDTTPNELEQAFAWNLSQATAFKDIRPEMVSSSVYVKIAEALGKITDKIKHNVPDEKK